MRGKAFLNVLAINLGAGLVALVAFASFDSGWSSVDVAIQLTTSLVFANCIGSCVAYASTRLGGAIGARPFPVNWALLVAVIAGATVPGCALAISILVAAGAVPMSEFWRFFTGSLRVSTIIALVFGVSSFLYENVRLRLDAARLELQSRELREERALKLAAEARLASLESRVQPHFLFNTLNSISALIREDPARAERTVERLAALLRFTLDAHRRRTVSLAEEVKIVTDYLEIERARYGERLRYSFHVPAELEGVAVPPLALQTLVENGVKHAVATRREGGDLRVSCRYDGERVVLDVSDDGSGFAADSEREASGGQGSGHGLETLEGRLAALFGDDARLSVAREGGRTVVSIALPGTPSGASVRSGERKVV
jgi:sensor histidine kinase YesM